MKRLHSTCCDFEVLQSMCTTAQPPARHISRLIRQFGQFTMIMQHCLTASAALKSPLSGTH